MNQDEFLSCTRTSGKNVEMKNKSREKKKESRAGGKKNLTRGAKRKGGKKPEKKKYMKT